MRGSSSNLQTGVGFELDTGPNGTGVPVRVGTKILTISCTWDRVDNRLVMPFLHIFADDVCFIIWSGDV